MSSLLENKVICSKKDIILVFDKKSENYKLNFNINNNINIDKYANFNIYELLFKLNKDIVESIEIIDLLSENQANILIILKEIGDSIKIPKNYIFVTINKKYLNDNIIFESINNNNNIENIKNKIMNCNKIICEYSILKISKNNNIVNFYYEFKFKLQFQQSNIINNIIALLIKKVFYKLKVFIENSIYNNNNDL